MEQSFERLLNISTSGNQKNFNEFIHYNRYEPTSYYVLEALLHNYPLLESDNVVDFGSGKGRLNFFLNHFFKCRVTGVEMNKYYYEEALTNTKNYLAKNKGYDPSKISFVNCIAEDYEISPNENKFYFFNPFSVQIFIKVVTNIIYSVVDEYRPVDLILYYPSEDYIYYLENYTMFHLVKEIKLNEHYKQDNRERILVYRLQY